LILSNFYLIFLVVALASFTQGVVGFAFSLITVPLLALFLSPVTAVGLNLVIASFCCAVVYFSHRKEVEYKKVLKYILFAAISVPVGVYFLKSLNEHVIMISLGAAVILLTWFSMQFSDKDTLKFLKNKISGFIASFISGFLGGAFTAPGPPIIAYFYNAQEDKKQAKANAQFYFVALDIVIIPLFLKAGILNKRVFINSLFLIPVVFLFSRLGVVFARKLSGNLFSSIVNVFLILLGFFLIIKNVISLAN
jgi:uncharacterized protein